MKTFKRILVPVDFSVSAQSALESALAIAKAFGGSVDVLHTWTAPTYLPAFTALKLQNNEPVETVQGLAVHEAKRQMESFLGRVTIPSGVEVNTRIEFGSPAETTIQASTAYDLIVMGTHGREGFQKLMMGSVAQKVVQRSLAPVLTVREDKVDAAEEAELRRHPEERVVYGVLDSPEKVGRAFQGLQESGISLDDISLLMSEATHRALDEPENQEALKGAAAGSIFGGSVGGILGGLTSLSALALGSSIGLMVLGPAVALAAAGGLAGGLLGWGIPQDHAHRIQEALEEGNSVVAVHLRDRAELEKIEATLNLIGASHVHLGR